MSKLRSQSVETAARVGSTGNGTLPQVVVLGFDSADADLIIRWAGESVLPTFRRLLDDAAWGKIDNPPGVVAGTVWQTFHTGVWPGRHGHYEGSKHFDPESYEDKVYIAREDLPRPAVWEILGRSGKRFAVLDAPFSFLSDDANGLHINGWGSHERRDWPGQRLDFRTSPPELYHEVLAKYGRDPLGMHEVQCDAFKPRNLKELIPFRDALLRRIEIKTRMVLDLLARERWAYFEADFGGAHCMGHQCWHYHDPAHPRYDPAAARVARDPLRDVYVALDQALAQLLEAVDRNATVLVYCSHGMGPNYTATDGMLDKILLGLEGLESPRRLEQVIGLARRLWRGAPGRLRNLLVPLRARDLEAAVQKRIQPSKAERRYFEVHLEGGCGGVRINLKGREAHGKVEPGEEYEEVCAALTRDLLDVVNDATRKPLVARVLRTSSVYDGPFVSRMPDLLVEWSREAPIVRASSPKIGIITDSNPSLRSGDHRPVGLFAAIGPHIRPGALGRTVSVVDFAPTVTALLGVEGGDFDGTPIDELLDRPSRRVESGRATLGDGGTGPCGTP